MKRNNSQFTNLSCKNHRSIHNLSSKYIVSIFVAVCILLSNFAVIDASALFQLTPVDTYSEAEAVINQYAPDNTVTYTISGYKMLRSPSGGDLAYTVYALEPYGYAIILNDGYDLMEANYSVGSSSPIDITSPLDYYYGGPDVYYTACDNKYINVVSGNSIVDNDISKIAETENHVRSTSALITGNSLNNSRSTTATTSYFVEQTYFANLNNYGENENGTCTVVASCILLRFYDYFMFDSYVASNYEMGTGTSNEFHELMNDYVYGTAPEGGIRIRNASVGINSYLDARSINTEMLHVHTPQTSVLSTMNTLLSAGTPLVASYVNTIPYGEDGYENHSVVVYGVQYTSIDPINTAKYTCHKGWYPEYNATVIDGNWFYECGWIECSLTNHS